MRAVDTNVLVRLIVRDNPDETASAIRFSEAGIWTATLAFAEAIWVLGKLYGFGPQDLADTIEMLLDNPKLTVQDADAVSAALALFRAKPSLGFTDCLILALARKAGHLPLGTFDRKLARVGGAQKL